MYQKGGEKKILVAISGGMDSAVVAALLKSEGHSVTGLHLQLCESPGAGGFMTRCSLRSNPQSARAVCTKLDIPFKILDAVDAFEAEVMDPSVHDYLQVRKPNPCVRCHQRVKFRYLDEYARRGGYDLIATGHFAQTSREPSTGSPRLQKAAEAAQDQSYYLYGVPAEVLARTLMPLGGISKAMVRKLAREFGVPEREASGVQGPECFSAGPTTRAFIEKRTAPSVRGHGIVRTQGGEVLGDHDGMYAFSLGDQRVIEDRRNQNSKNAEQYVIGFEVSQQSVIIGAKSALYRQELYASGARWIRPPQGIHGIRCKARTHRHMKEVPCWVTLFENQVVHVLFDEPLLTLLAGQSVVFYDEDEILGGAIIDRALEPRPIAALT